MDRRRSLEEMSRKKIIQWVQMNIRDGVSPDFAPVGDIIDDIIRITLIDCRRVETRRCINYWCTNKGPAGTDAGYDTFPKIDECVNEIITDMAVKVCGIGGQTYEEYTFILQYEHHLDKSLVVTIQKDRKVIADHIPVSISHLYEEHPQLYELIVQ